ncbi:uncharacterized protein LOC113205075 isoform X3 [Frankliniella occidentalis]|uniref:Uncharacterized protein LOC113205075 isoform X3 n=1 Tax=Frankliniella occidentalis TaxID=133901 RepID=A0A9C6TRF6_FRAOC|nr:uncharacterized protein LOC113205075 isoform X3 [Frankliniella occidentalis]
MARLARKQGSARLSESPIKLLLLEWLYWMCHPSTSGQSRFTQLVNIWYLNKVQPGPRMADSVWNTAAVCVDWATTIEYQYNTLLDGSAIFVSLACITTLTRSLAEIQTQINRGVKVGDCLRWAALQSRVTAGCRELEETFADLLPHILISAYFTPLLAIVDVVFNGRKADLFSLALSPVVLLVLWPMCDIGDELAKARERLCPAAYLGPWLEEGCEQTRVRLCLMLFAYGRHGLLRTRGPGGGVLNRGTFTTAISSWIKFLNALINLQSASRHQVRGK